jgi:hypothetical protein
MPTPPTAIGAETERGERMSNSTAGGGPDTGEMAALQLPIDEMTIRLRGLEREVTGYRMEIEHLVKTVHRVYHERQRVSKPPCRWEECNFILCRKVRSVLFGEEEL